MQNHAHEIRSKDMTTEIYLDDEDMHGNRHIIIKQDQQRVVLNLDEAQMTNRILDDLVLSKP